MVVFFLTTATAFQRDYVTISVGPRRRDCEPSAGGSVAGAIGLEPTTAGFGDRCSAKLSYTPAAGEVPVLLRLAVKCMPSLSRTVFEKLDPVRIVPLVLARRVRPLLALGAGQLERGSRFDSCHLVMR